MGESAKSGLKGMDLIMGMGAPPKSSDDDSQDFSSDSSDADSDTDENMFDDTEEPDEMLVGAAHDIMSAFHSRSPEKLAEALKSFVSMT